MKALGVGTVLIAVGTWAVGWWAVPVVGALIGVIWPDGRPALLAGTAGGLGWALLLMWGSASGPVGDLAGTVGGVMGLPGFEVLLVTVLFPALLAGAGGALAGALRRERAARAGSP